jgi:DNA polymerase-3 subunit beta
MKVTVKAEVLHDLVKMAAMARAPGSTLPILTCVLLDFGESEISATRTNLDQTLKVSIDVPDADFGKPWSVVLPAAPLLKILSTEKGDLVMDQQKSKLRITAEHAVYTMETFPVDEWPRGETVDGTGADIECSRWSDKLAHVAVASSDDNTRYILNGVLLELGRKHGLRLVATDGRRLHVIEESCKAADEVTIVVPTPAVKVLSRLGGESESLSLAVQEGKLAAFWWFAGRVKCRLQTKLIEGTFPNWRQVVPAAADDDTVVRIQWYDVARALDRVECCINGQGDVPVRVGTRWDGITLSATIPERSAVVETVGHVDPAPADKTGVTWRCGLNGQYVRDAVSKASGEIEMRIPADDTGPVLVSAGAGFRAVIMPMRIVA